MTKKMSKIFKVGMADNKSLNIPSAIVKMSMFYNVPVFVIDDTNKNKFYYEEDGYFNFKEHNQSVDGYMAENAEIGMSGDCVVGEITLFSDKEILGEFVNYEIEVLDYENKDGVTIVKDMAIKSIYIK